MDEITARLMLAEDPEQLMREDMAEAIRARRAQGPPGPVAGDRLRILLVGYAGAGNIGADIRVGETARQLRAIFGRDRLALGLVTRGDSAVGLDDVSTESLGGYFPATMDSVIARYHAVLVCEGSLFKSNFSNVLTTMLAGALGLASAQGKPAIAYGVEAGEMDEDMADFVRAHCRESLIFCRSAESLELVRERLGLPAQPGADTAWTFEPAPPAEARALLAEAGWNRSDPIVALCPINPFWWPVRPDVLRALGDEVGSDDHYDSILYHHRSDESDAAFERYVAALAGAAREHVEATGAFPVIIGMERLDRAACTALAASLPGAPPIFTSAELDARRMVAILRQAAMVVTSRYHAAVTAIPAGIPVIGVTMDERLRNLMADLGRPDLAIECGSLALEAELRAAMRTARDGAEALLWRALVGRQLQLQADMGRRLAGVLARSCPGILPEHAAAGDLAGFLPPLSPDLAMLFDAARPDPAGQPNIPALT